MAKENDIPLPPAAASSAPAQAASAQAKAASAAPDDCTPATDVLKTKKADGKDNYMFTVTGQNGERVNAFVDGTFLQKDGKTVLSEDARVTLMGTKNGKSFGTSRSSEGNVVQDLLTREQMLDPSVSGFTKSPQIAAKIRAAAAEMFSCSNVGPAVELMSATPGSPLATPAAPAPPVQKQRD